MTRKVTKRRIAPLRHSKGTPAVNLQIRPLLTQPRLSHLLPAHTLAVNDTCTLHLQWIQPLRGSEHLSVPLRGSVRECNSQGRNFIRLLGMPLFPRTLGCGLEEQMCRTPLP